MADIDDSAWDGPAAMSAAAAADNPAAAYRAICAGRKAGDPELQSSWALPHHRSPGAPANANGVRAAAAALGGARGGVQGLTNRSEAQSHIDNHMADVQAEARSEDEPTIIQVPDDHLEIRSLAKREIDIRVMPWNLVINTSQGAEEFRRGAFADTDPGKVLLMGLEHEAHLGIGQSGQPVLTRRPTGKGLSLDDRADGAYMTFRVAKTQAGDEVLALADERITSGASIEFVEIPGGTVIETRNGRRTRVHQRVNLLAVSTTYRPAYGGAQVLAVRSQQGDAAMAEEPAAVAATTEDAPPVQYALDTSAFQQALDESMTKFGDRLERLEERSRSQFTIPNPEPDKPKATRGDWLRTVLGMMSGERMSQHDLQVRALDDLITTDNIGVVPEAFLTEIIGVIDPRRPFMGSTRRLNTPASGMSLTMPKIVTRPTVAVQATEKTELSSTATSITTVTFDAVSKGGAGDISLQLLKRSDPSFLGLYLELLAEAYAIEAESEAVEELLASGVNSGGALNPEDLSLGGAWSDSFDAIARSPDTIWLSSSAVAEFIDAKSGAGTNIPLYSNITANVTAGGGVSGTIQGLRAVHVPALNATGVDVVVGPSSGFAWAEDGTYTLQVDVPAKAGRDVAIIGMLWFAPLYPAAFTAYSVASGGS